ncbi:MAG: hypothetical protein IJ033_06285 [Clostridia bacterium]|nr:hypothetical protein [Clostridia bacterium]
MKKFLTLILILSFVFVVLVGCNNDEEPMATTKDIFNNFSSNGEYTSCVETLRLPEGTVVSSYDGSNDIFITYKEAKYGNFTIGRYGFASSTEELIEPRYTSIIDIRGDYAICLRTALVNNEETVYVGLVKFRGVNGGVEYGFSYPYAVAINQFTFLSDKYIAVMGNKNMTEFAASGYSYATVYDYASADGLLEVGIINDIDNSTKFVCEDGYIAAVGTNTTRLYDMSKINDKGIFIMQHSVTLLKEGDGYVQDYSSSEAYYVGGGWFIISTTFSCHEEYDTYEIPLLNEEDNKTYYTLIKSVRISIKSGKQFDCERVTMVSNKYTDRDVRSIVDAINAEDATAAATWSRPYLLPVIPTSPLVQDGYSIVYYYYYYYNTENIRSWAISFMICDADGNMTAPTNLVMPVAYVDGYGLQNADPNFSIAIRDVGYHSYENGTRTTLIPVTDTSAFENQFIHNGVIISYEQRIEPQGVVAYIGATKVDGTRITAYEYDSFSPFFGNYAIASKVGELNENGSIKSQAFYRISLDGTVTSIDDCYQMFNGTYSTFSGGKFGLKSNAGTTLIANKCEKVSCVDYFFRDGKVFNTVVATVEGNRGVIYELR